MTNIDITFADIALIGISNVSTSSSGAIFSRLPAAIGSIRSVLSVYVLLWSAQYGYPPDLGKEI
jgi:hypothetical protein